MNKELKELQDEIEMELRCQMCNGTTDCENYPECPEGTNGCEVQNVLDRIMPHITSALLKREREKVK